MGNRRVETLEETSKELVKNYWDKGKRLKPAHSKSEARVKNGPWSNDANEENHQRTPQSRPDNNN